MKVNVFQTKNTFEFILKTVLKSFFLAVVITVVFGYAFGYRYLNILTSSMSPYMPINTIIVIKDMPISKIEIGDVVTYNKGNTNVTHRVVGFDTNGNLIMGTEYFYENTYLANPGMVVTMNTSGIDPASPINDAQVVGVVVAHFEGLGKVFTFVQSNIIIIMIGLVLILFVFSFI